MHTLKGSDLCSVAQYLGRFCMRLKSTRGPPSAPLGARRLANTEDVFQHNMWDHVHWTEEEKERARKYDTDACQYWNKFYETHHGKFFKDRQWLFREFPELLPLGLRRTSVDTGSQWERRDISSENLSSGRTVETCQDRCSDPCPQHRDTDIPECPTSVDARAVDSEETLVTSFPGQHADFRILEVGCGVGNSVFPIVKSIKETGAFVYCCDFSSHAIQLVKDHPDYDQSVCHAFLHDLCEEGSSFPIPPQSLDVVMAVFVLSSIHPARLQAAVKRLTTYLKPGGIFLFRDYGRYDLSQLRFKKDEVHSLFTNAGLKELQILEDRRLQVNRGKKVVMHRVWMQSKYQKTHSTG
ncbi:Methyltransferase-like protein 2-A [Merluccius polli]|uniref:tRNA N(3)-cytidine methyltransferase n=1 Tax=Merluccius polli TaxID=89951 RepID=A0AA47MMK3_MERPO|nr:Methyltransferase-like protein 2-A [Merluccius polli]